jgi:hypothetical protein
LKVGIGNPGRLPAQTLIALEFPLLKERPNRPRRTRKSTSHFGRLQEQAIIDNEWRCDWLLVAELLQLVGREIKESLQLVSRETGVVLLKKGERGAEV